MKPEDRAKLDDAAFAVGESLAAAWAHFHLLRGIDNGRIKNGQVVQTVSLFYDRLWRSAFDAFFAKVGIVLDTKRGTYSLPNFLTLARRYADPEVKKLLPSIEFDLAKGDAPLARLKRWRHEVVAHKPAACDDVDFHAKNRMTLTEIERALEQLDDYFNQISLNVLAVHSEHRSAFEEIVQQAELLFAAAAVGLPQHK